MVHRLLSFWRAVKGEREYPSSDQIDPDAMADLWPDCCIVDVASDPQNPTVLRAGEALSAHVNCSLADSRVSEIVTRTLPAVAMEYFTEVLRKRVPVSRGGEFVDADGVTILYRSIILPLSDEDERITSLLVGANCRKVVAAEGGSSTEELR